MKKPLLISLISLCFLANTPLVSAHSNHEHIQQIPAASVSANQMQKAADKLIASLDEKKLNAVLLPFSENNVRSGWSNTPSYRAPRNGLSLTNLNKEQRGYFHDLLRASTSTQGYLKIWNAIRSDEFLREEGLNRGDLGRFAIRTEGAGSNYYYISFQGNPRKDKNWGWLLTGHHLGANFTVVGNKATFTPLFIGSDPTRVGTGIQAGHYFLPQERQRAFELVSSLNEEQSKKAVLGETFKEGRGGAVDFIGPGRKDSLKTYHGIKASELNEGQQALLWQLVKEYVEYADFDISAAHLEKIKKDGLDKLHFSWQGKVAEDSRALYRVHGPSILIDYVDQESQFDWNRHPHAIVRDPSNDYGEDWLGIHFKEEHKLNPPPKNYN